MASTKKGRTTGVTAGSFFDLKAELSKREDEFSKLKAQAGGAPPAVVGGVKRPGKKPTVWARQNKGVNARSQRDVELEAISKPTLESARAALERKALIYEKLKKGKTGGLNDKQFEGLLVDFDRKAMEEGYEDSEDEEVDESLVVPQAPEGDDPIVEYEDEFGRIRTARRSEVPRDLPQKEEEPEEDDDPFVIYGDQKHFPVYEPSAERAAAIAESAKETNPEAHYDGTHENRAKGAGFYRFSADEETRQRQMEELRRTREETERKREETGAEEGVKEEEGEGEGPAGKKVVSRAVEKRKRELEERRKAVEAKRRKVFGNEEVERRREDAQEKAANDFLADLEKEMNIRAT